MGNDEAKASATPYLDEDKDTIFICNHFCTIKHATILFLPCIIWMLNAYQENTWSVSIVPSGKRLPGRPRNKWLDQSDISHGPVSGFSGGESRRPSKRISGWLKMMTGAVEVFSLEKVVN